MGQTARGIRRKIGILASDWPNFFLAKYKLSSGCVYYINKIQNNYWILIGSLYNLSLI